MDKEIKSTTPVEKQTMAEKKLDSKEVKKEVFKKDQAVVKTAEPKPELKETAKSDTKLNEKVAEKVTDTKAADIKKDVEDVKGASAVKETVTPVEVKTTVVSEVSNNAKNQVEKATQSEKKAPSEPEVLAKESPKNKTPKKTSSKSSSTKASKTTKSTKTTAKKQAKPVSEKTSKLKKVVKKSEKAAQKAVNDVVVSTYIQYLGKEINYEDILKRVKEDWIGKGNEEASIQNLELYVKPEESAVYYVVNGMMNSGKITF